MGLRCEEMRWFPAPSKAQLAPQGRPTVGSGTDRAALLLVASGTYCAADEG